MESIVYLENPDNESGFWNGESWDTAFQTIRLGDPNEEQNTDTARRQGILDEIIS